MRRVAAAFLAVSAVSLTAGCAVAQVGTGQQGPSNPSFERQQQITQRASQAGVLNTTLGTIRSLHKKISEAETDYERKQYQLFLRIHAGISRERFQGCNAPAGQRLCKMIIMVASYPLSDPANTWLVSCIEYESDTLVRVAALAKDYLQIKGNSLVSDAFDELERGYLTKRAAAAPLCEPPR